METNGRIIRLYRKDIQSPKNQRRLQKQGRQFPQCSMKEGSEASNNILYVVTRDLDSLRARSQKDLGVSRLSW